MRVCVAVPSISDFYFSNNRMSALGARVVVRIVEQARHEAVFMDFPMTAKGAKPIPRPDALGYLDPFVLDETGPVSFFTGYKRLGPEPSECARMIARIEPDLLLISCFAYAYAEDAIALARAVRATMPELTIAAGGAGATVLPEKFFRSGTVSFVLTGEAETNLLQFLTECEKRSPGFTTIPGLITRVGGRRADGPAGGRCAYVSCADGRIVSGPPMRETEEHELEWVGAISSGRTGGKRLTTMLSRGCPRRCAFCSNHLCHGRRFRKVSLERVIGGIDSIAAGKAEKDVDRLNLEDDNLLADREYTAAVVDYARLKLGAPAITTENGVDAGFLDGCLLDTLIDAGLAQLNLSLGSIDPEVLAGVRRNEIGKKVASLTSQAAARGIAAVTYFICGLPGDSRQTVIDNLLFLASLKTTIGISLFYPTPGIEGFEDPSVFLESSPALCCSSSAYPWTRSLSTRSLVTAFRLARLVNLTKDPAQRCIHEDLIQKIFAKKRLYTWRKAGGARTAVPVPDMDEDLVEAVVSQLDVDMLPAGS